MKLSNHSLTVFAAFLLSTATLLGGCATTGIDRSVKTSNSISDVESDMKRVIVQIDATSSSLDSLVKPENPDLKKTFTTYSDNLENLDSDGKRLIKRMDEMSANSKEYFEEWKTSGVAYKNPEISALSEERRGKLATIYAQVPTAGAGVKSAYLAYLSDLKEIKSYLSNDLTPKGIETITPTAQKSIEDKAALKESLQKVLSALDDIKGELYSGKK